MSRSDRRAAFTLIEVLAAVAVLGILFTVLARSAAQGLRAEGESRRRMEATLLAELTLQELSDPSEEEDVAAPPPGIAEFEEEGFLVTVEVTNTQIAPVLAAVAPEEDPRLRRRPGAEAEEERRGFLQDPDPRRDDPLRTVLVRVSWDDGIFERSVVRRSFAFDRNAVSDLLPQPEPETEEGPEDGAEGEDGDAAGEEAS